MADAGVKPTWTYWSAALVLIVFGVLTGFSIGLPFLFLGLVLLILGPLRDRPHIFWPWLVATLAFLAAFILVTPLGCTMAAIESTASEGSNQSPSQGMTTCSNLLGLNYSGEGDYRAPRWPALLSATAAGATGLAVATLMLRDGSKR